MERVPEEEERCNRRKNTGSDRRIDTREGERGGERET